jgi:succinyl-diaminopimelate desuccinylase
MAKTQVQTGNLIHLLAELVQMPTVTRDQAATREALRWIRWQLGHLPLHVTDFEHNGYASLILTTQKTKHPKLWLGGHIDVIPASPQAFVPRVSNGRLIGRGTFDMKFAIAAYIKLLLELGDNLPKYNLAVAITSDEERGGEDGLGQLVKAGYSADVLVMPDATSGWEMPRMCKGFARYRIESRGRSAHGSRPWLGNNAINNLMDFLTELRAMFPGEPCRTSGHKHHSINVGELTGGSVGNQVPDYAEAALDFRLMPGQSGADLDHMLADLLAKHAGIKCIQISEGEPYEVDTENDYVKKFAGLIHEVTGSRPKYILSHGSNDSRFMSAKGVPVILTRPHGGGQHSDEEWVDLADVNRFYEILKRYTEALHAPAQA